jgi:hypothetical protein
MIEEEPSFREVSFVTMANDQEISFEQGHMLMAGSERGHFLEDKQGRSSTNKAHQTIKPSLMAS